MKDAWRYLLRTPRFTIACASIVALGVTMSTVLFAVIEATLLDPWPYEGADRIVTVRANYPEQGRERFALWSGPEVEDLSRATDVFDAVIAGIAEPMTFQEQGDPERIRAAALTPNAFTMLGVPARLGRTLRPADAVPGAPPVALVSDAFWRDRLGADASVVGRVVRIGSAQVTIVGVMPPAFRWWDREVWLPLRIDPFTPRADRRYYVQGRLRRGVSPSPAERQLSAFVARLRADHPDVQAYAHMSVSIHTLLDDVLRELRPALGLLLMAVLLVMAVAAANLSSVVLGRAASRQAEFAVRYALGASARSVIAQLLIENVLISAIGAGAGVVAALFLLHPLLSLVPYGFIPAEAHVRIDWRVAACAIGVSLVLGTLAAIIPASRTASLPLSLALRRHDVRTGTRRVSRIRYVFVVCQVMLGLVLTVAGAAGAGALLQSLERHPGFDPFGAWTARVGDGRPAAIHRILDQMRTGRTLPVAAISALPVGDLPTVLAAPVDTADDMRETDRLVATPDFESALGLTVRGGRMFRETDNASAAPVCVVTESLARRTWQGEALGRQLSIRDATVTVHATVIGVVADIDARGDGVLRPLVFTPLAQTTTALPAVIIVGRGASVDGLSSLRAAVRQTDPGAPVDETRSLADARREAVGPRLFAAVLLGIFCVAVLVLCTVGLHTLVAELARERRRETAIRLALGARPRRLFAREIVRGLSLVAAGALAAIPAWIVLPKLMGAVFKGVDGVILPAVAIGTALIAATSMAAVAFPAWRSAYGTNVVTNTR